MDDDDLSQTVIRPSVSPVAPPTGPNEDTIVAAPPPLVRPPGARAPRRSPARAADARAAGETAPPTIPAPARHRISVNSAEPIPIDVPVLIGRDPRPPRVAAGLTSRFVRVPSPRREVSATHIELRQDGSCIIATDMRSTNGTMITVPGAPVFALHAGGSLVIAPGTTLDLGDDNVVEVMPIGRLRARDNEPLERLSP